MQLPSLVWLFVITPPGCGFRINRCLVCPTPTLQHCPPSCHLAPPTIQIKIQSAYIAEQSDPAIFRYVFSYTVTLSHQGGVPAKLLRRHWIITDGENKVQEVKGEGVVGEQPHLKPGQQFEYTSGTMIATPVGTMRGSYHMVTDEGDVFDVLIPEFVLSMPRVLH